jgi:hypothetical protein
VVVDVEAAWVSQALRFPRSLAGGGLGLGSGCVVVASLLVES